MKKNFYYLVVGCDALIHWIATRFSTARNDEAHNRHCEAKPRQSRVNRYQPRKPAFSLIELLISLIVISLITTAFAPIISKQIKRGGISVGQSGGKISNQCDSINPNCQLCQGTECLVCTLNCPDGQYADKEACECKSCSSFGVCSRCTKDGCTQCNGGYGLVNKRCDNKCSAGTYSSGSSTCSTCGDKKFSNEGASFCTDCPAGQTHNSNHSGCIDITCSADEFVPSGTSVCAKCNSVYANCAKCDKDSGCSECLLGYGLVSGVCKPYIKPKNQADCDQFNGAVFVPINNDGSGICVTKRNVGDPDGPTIDFPDKITKEAAKDVTGTCYVALAPGHTITTQPGYCYTGGGATRTCGATDGTANCTGTIANVDRITSYLAFNYESCKRTLCNFTAAQYACSEYKTEKTKAGDWRLPTKEEVTVWKSLINSNEPSKDGKSGNGKFNKTTSTTKIQKYKGANGLQLCDNAGGYGSARCGYSSKRCGCHYCNPYGIWAYNPTGTKTIPVYEYIPGKICTPGACSIANVTYHTIEGLPFVFSLHKGVAYLGSDLGDDEKVKIKDNESVKAEIMSARCVLDKFID